MSGIKRTLAAAAAVAMAVAGPAVAVAGPAVTPLVSVDWLADNLGGDGLTIIDLRSGSQGAAAYAAAHVPGAIRVDYPGAWRVDRDGVPGLLPETAALEAHLSALGVGADSSVVLVPAGTGSTELGGATWVYFVLKYLGHDAVAILDGGAAAWAVAALPVEAGAGATPQPARFTADVRPDILATIDVVVANLGTGTAIVDARPPNQFTGEAKSGLVTRAGHIPGAVNIDNATFYDAASNRLKPRDELAALVPPAVATADRVIVYCNTGHWSSINWFVMHELLGLDQVDLYEGSMAEWSRSDHPVVTGTAG